MWGIEENETRPETPQRLSADENTPPILSNPRPPSPPPRPPSPTPSDFDDTPQNSGRNTPLDDDDYPPCRLPGIATSIEFIRMVRNATLDSQFSPEELDVLRNPWAHESSPEDDPYLKFSIQNFINLLGCAQDRYAAMRENYLGLHPGAPVLLYDQVKRRARNLSGIITWEHDMCVRGCVGFTGPFTDLGHCPHPDCGEPRYDQKKLEDSGGILKVPRKVFTTFPVGPQLQAHRKSPETAEKMSYRWRKTQELWQERGRTDRIFEVYDDMLSGDAYLSAVEDGSIGEHDTVLMLSIDGVQLYQNKKSDCWIYIWIILDLGPEERYKIRNILPGGVILGPDAPGNIESFLFPGLSHVSALQKEGLRVWDAHYRKVVISLIFLLLVLADAVAMAELSVEQTRGQRQTGRNDLPGRVRELLNGW